MAQNSTPESIKTIFLIRHGQTDFNKKGIVQGSGINSQLNDTGRLQAERFFLQYRHVPFSKIYTSTLTRTVQTVSSFIDILKIQHEVVPEFDEINWGIMEGAEPGEESTALFNQVVHEWRTGNLNYNGHQGESAMMLYERQQRGLQKLESEWPGSPVLICMHGRAMRSFLCLLTGTPLEQMDEFEHGNVCLYQLEKKNDDRFFKVTLRNSRAHLHDYA